MHDIFKAIIRYYPDEVFALVKDKFNSKVFETRHIVSAKDEVMLFDKYDFVDWNEFAALSSRPNNSGWYELRNRIDNKLRHAKYADCSWSLASPEDPQTYHFTIIHEIKTGKFDINEVIDKYNNLYVYSYRRTGGRSHVTEGAPLWVWAWHDKINEQTPNKQWSSKLKRRSVRYFELEWITPLVVEKINNCRQ
jgi:hypothetical protein